MSQLGQTRHFDRAPITSGLLQQADLLRVRRHVSNVPIADKSAVADTLAGGAGMADDDEGALLGFAGSMGELLSCLVRVRRCLGRALRNTDPRQFFAAPDMQVGCEPARVVERAGL